MMKKNICVFCGSRPGNDPNFSSWAYALGSHIAKSDHGLVFGGGGGGLMGIVAQGALDHQGQVIGIIPNQLQLKEGLVENLTEVHHVQTMAQRKQLMDDFAQAYIVLPGGIGTLDEFFDVWATAQTGFHTKPIILANWSGYYNPLITFLNESIDHGFMSKSHWDKVKVVNSLEDLVQTIHF